MCVQRTVRVSDVELLLEIVEEQEDEEHEHDEDDDSLHITYRYRCAQRERCGTHA
jgi:hypothetical protein